MNEFVKFPVQKNATASRITGKDASRVKVTISDISHYNMAFRENEREKMGAKTKTPLAWVVHYRFMVLRWHL